MKQLINKSIFIFLIATSASYCGRRTTPAALEMNQESDSVCSTCIVNNEHCYYDCSSSEYANCCCCVTRNRFLIACLRIFYKESHFRRDTPKEQTAE